MAEDEQVVETTDEEQAFSQWLADLSTDDEEEQEAEVAEDEENALKVARKTQKVVTEFITEQKVDDMVDRFMASAPQDAKELFAIYRIGNEDPKQLKRIMDLAVTKAAETKKPAAEEVEEEETVEEKAEKRAVQIAKSEFGVGPISGGSGSDLTPEQQKYQELYGQVEKDGDPNALLSLIAEDSPFIDSVLNGREISKK